MCVDGCCRGLSHIFKGTLLFVSFPNIPHIYPANCFASVSQFFRVLSSNFFFKTLLFYPDVKFLPQEEARPEDMITHKVSKDGKSLFP